MASFSACGVVGACAVLSIAAGAVAQCDVYRLGVPDFDQRRALLPGGGNCYCCPTSTSNWLAYISNNGYPDVFLGPRDWQSAANFADVTTLIGWVGQAMGTQDGVDPDGGGPLPPNGCTTSFGGFVNGATGWLDSVAPGEFIAYTVAANGADAVTPQELYAQLAFGALVGVSYRGFAYTPPNPSLGLPARWVLQPTGHVVTLTRMTDACGASPRMWYRDPAGLDGDNTSQAAFVTQYSDLAAVPGLYASSATAQPVFRTMWMMSDVSNVNMVNAICAVTPVHGLSAQPQVGEVTLSGMWNPETLTISPPSTHVIPGAAGVVSLRMSPRVGQAFVICADSAGGTFAGRLDLAGASGATFVPMGGIVNPGPFVFTRSGRVIGVEQGNRLYYADVGGTSMQKTVMVTLSRTPVAIAADDGAGEAVLLLPAVVGGPGAAVQRVSDGTLARSAAEDLPAGVVVDEHTSAAFDARFEDGALYLANGAPGAASPLVRVTRSDSTGQLVAETVSHPLIVQPRALQVTHRGTLVFESQGICRALRFDDGLAQWVADTDHPFHGQMVGPTFDLASSRSLIDSLDPDGSFDNEQNVDTGPGVPDCIGDFDGDGVVQVPDIFRYLSQWFGSDRVADIDLDGDTDVPDIFGFLSLWFAGC